MYSVSSKDMLIGDGVYVRPRDVHYEHLKHEARRKQTRHHLPHRGCRDDPLAKAIYRAEGIKDSDYAVIRLTFARAPVKYSVNQW